MESQLKILILYGALAGGPDQEDDYEDVRSNIEKNYVAIDNNTRFTTDLA